MENRAVFSEVKVKVSNEERTLKHEFPTYDLITVSEDDPILRGYVETVVKAFQDVPDRVTLDIHVEWG